MYTLIAILLDCTELSSFYFGSLHAGETYELLLLLTVMDSFFSELLVDYEP